MRLTKTRLDKLIERAPKVWLYCTRAKTAPAYNKLLDKCDSNGWTPLVHFDAAIYKVAFD